MYKPTPFFQQRIPVRLFLNPSNNPPAMMQLPMLSSLANHRDHTYTPLASLSRATPNPFFQRKIPAESANTPLPQSLL